MTAQSALRLDALEALAPHGMTTAFARIRARAWEPIAFRLSHSGPTPDRLRAAPRDFRVGDPRRGEEIYKGTFELGGATLHAPREGPWVAGGPSSIRFREELESFSWLRHLGAIDRLVPEGVVEARDAARAFAESWILSHTAFAEPAWAPAIVGRRIMSWITEATLLGANADLIWRARFHSSLAQQARYLSSTMELAPQGLPRLTAMTAVVLGCLALGDGGPRRSRAVQLLLTELESQILPDGGHRSRSPAIQAELLSDLLILHEAFLQSHTPCPGALEAMIERIAPPLHLLHVGEGQLAAFHGSGLEEPAQIAALLCAVEETRQTPSMPDWGYERMTAGRTLLLIDTGPAPPFEFASTAHASALAFELSSHGQRMVVNCGRSPQDDGDGRVFRTAAAHSTLSFIVRAAPSISRAKLAARLSGGPLAVAVHRQQEPTSGSFVELSHDGHGAELGRRHRRRLYLQDGDLRGEDQIEPIAEATATPTVPFRLRFHLHPEVEVTAEETGARLALPNGEMWHFRCRGGELTIADSIFNGSKGALAAKQLVIKGEATSETIAVSWAFKRERSNEAPSTP